MVANPRNLSLHGAGLKLNTREDIAPHLAEYDPEVVEEIHLGGNTIGIEAAQALAEFLEKTKVLKVADFADIFTGRLITEIPQALSAICDALKDKTSLVEINLSDNAFGGRSVDPMVPFLTTNRSFQILKLNNNGLGPAGGAVIADALLQSALLSKKEGKPSNLRTVICGRNRLEDGSASAWAAAFRAHGGLTEIRMPQNGIRMDGIAELMRGISACTGLQLLDLEDNTFGDIGSKAMAEVLAQWPALHTLNLSDCHLAKEGDISPIVETLADGSNPNLATLRLQNNNFDTQTYQLLSDGVESGLGMLRLLELQWNDIEEDDEGLEILRRVLKGRGGKLVTDDDDEEEEEEEEEEDREPEQESRPPVPSESSEPKQVASKAEDDALAELMGKVSIKA
ncbi:RNI-like protein [Phanerochaete sordida]|uniref:RNI-like protein n=1 Tax=Phanerochaete sordida TaxID=48140 RepID=A0A9P3G6Q6_9APHY|nr:RNI-like protein [Phanerochaete sordida]